MTMTTITPLKRPPAPLPDFDALGAALRHPAPPELSADAKLHFDQVNRISAAALADLEAVTDDIGKVRDEITLRAHMLGEATMEFDDLVAKARQGYGSIRNALEVVRARFAQAMKPVPTAPPETPAVVHGEIPHG